MYPMFSFLLHKFAFKRDVDADLLLFWSPFVFDFSYVVCEFLEILSSLSSLFIMFSVLSCIHVCVCRES